jgi:hypothetical protein
MTEHVCWMCEPPEGYCPACADEYQAQGAAIVFGLLGMAYALRARFVYEHHCRTCARLDDICRFCAGL